VLHPDSSVDAAHAAALESVDAVINGLHRKVPGSTPG
jgi:hypothetical protein